MHLSTNKTLRLLHLSAALIFTAQCSIVEAKRTDRRIPRNVIQRPASPGVPKGRDLVNSLPVATGLETTGIYGTPTTGLPSTPQHVVVSSPTSCVPGQANCAMPPQIQPNPNIIPNPPIWPKLLEGAMALFKGMSGSGSKSDQAKNRDGSSSSNRDRQGPATADRRPIPPQNQSRGSTGGKPVIATDRNRRNDFPQANEGPRPVGAGCNQSGTDIQPMIDATHQITISGRAAGQVAAGGSSASQVAAAGRSADQVPIILKHNGDAVIDVQAVRAGTIVTTRTAVGDQVLCTKTLQIEHLKCRSCTMTVKFSMAKTNSKNSCAPGNSRVSTCAPMVSLGKAGVTEASVLISDGTKNYTNNFLRPSPAPAVPASSSTKQAASSAAGVP